MSEVKSEVQKGQDFPGGPLVKYLPFNAGDAGSIPGPGTMHRPVHVLLPSPVSWVLEVLPSSGEGAPEKRSPGTSFPPGWEMQLTGGKSSEPPAGKKRAYCPWTIRLQECVRPDWCLTGLCSTIAYSSKLRPRPTRRRVWVRISKYCQGL